MALPSRASRVVCPSLQILKALPPNLLLGSMIPLDMSNNGISMIENSSFSGWGLLERPPLSVLPQEVILVSVVHVTSQKELMSSVCGASLNCVDASVPYSLCCH